MSDFLVDTGPIVALLAANDDRHAWAVEQCRSAPATVLTCDAVISKALFLPKRGGHDTDALFELVEAGFLRSEFDLHVEYRSVRALMKRYRSRPMSFADARLVRMADLRPEASLWTLDSDFGFYRKDQRQSLSLAAP